MRTLAFAVLAAAVLSTGCCHTCRPTLFPRLRGCLGCLGGGIGHRHVEHEEQYMGAGGPPTGQVAYPYYTTRGPRDFLADNPRGIGP